MSFLFNLWCPVQPTGDVRYPRRLSCALPLVTQPDAIRAARAARPNTALDLQVLGDPCREAQGDRPVTLVGAGADTDRDRLAEIDVRNHGQRGGGSHTRIRRSCDSRHGALHRIELRHIHRVGRIDTRSDIGDSTLATRRTDRDRVGFTCDRASTERNRVRRSSRRIGTQGHAVFTAAQRVCTDHSRTFRRRVGAIPECNTVDAGCRCVDTDGHRIGAGRAVVVVVTLRCTVVVHAVVMRTRRRDDCRQRRHIAVRRAQACRQRAHAS